MKKKMTVVGGLLMAVVLTGYSVAGTYAKYTESATDSDQATIAKWDVTVNAGSAKRLFNTANNNSTVNNRVAPGGYDTATWTIGAVDNGSEVEVDLKVSMTVENGVQKEITQEHYNTLVNAGLTDVVYTSEDGKYYYAPVVFSVKRGDAEAQKANNTKALEALFTNLDAKGETFVIGWNWAFEAKDLVAGVAADVAKLVDMLDTSLGKEHDPEKKIQITATAEATQKTMDRVTHTATVKTTANAEDVASYVADWGYVEANTAAVTFDGSTIGGSITKNTNANLVAKYPASDPVGYYYPITVEGTPGASFRMGSLNMKSFSIGNDGHTTVLMALDPVNKKPITLVMEDGTETTIDYTGLTFN